MLSKRFLLFALAFATILLITSEVVAAKEVASNHENEVDGAKYDRGYYNGGRGGGYNGGGHGGGYNGGGHGGGYNGGGHRGYNGGGGYNCRHRCCGRYGCRCCSTLAEATAYKQAHEAQTHN